jgi:hypothetical protein
VPEFSAATHRKKSKPKKPLILQWNFTIRSVGIAQAKEVLSEQKHF